LTLEVGVKSFLMDGIGVACERVGIALSEEDQEDDVGGRRCTWSCGRFSF